MKIVLADDHVLVRQGLKSLLEQSGFQIVGEASDGQEAINLVKELRPEIAVLDLGMPILNGVDAAREIIKSMGGQTKVILLTMYTEHSYVVAALDAGVSGYVLKSRAATGLLEAIRVVQEGDVYLSPGISRGVIDTIVNEEQTEEGQLSVRERQVLQLVAEGMSTKAIAGMLSISVKTAESHRSKIMQKLNIHDTAGLVLYAIRQGIIQP